MIHRRIDRNTALKRHMKLWIALSAGIVGLWLTAQLIVLPGTLSPVLTWVTFDPLTPVVLIGASAGLAIAALCRLSCEPD